MPYAKRFLAKLARFCRRIKSRSSATIIDDKKHVKLCHKACNTIRDDLDSGEQNDGNKYKKSNMLKRRNKNMIKTTMSEQVPESELSQATITKNNRMTAGKEASVKCQTYRNSDSELDDSPILETGISRMAFCRQLDSLLQRSLGHDVNRDASYC
ncbi:hypothetical protein ACLKA7_007313 [Drosophila subpalustris]